mmetsp:Transcript_47724/g.103857  ORF Transcript_47724/g.103857 Transcript_47724/m.103857 type:complete len:324 (-) Transcript_47724:75-1046(-)
MGSVPPSGPVTEKDSGDGTAPNLRLAWGYSGMQGWRDEMEDAHIAAASLGQLVGEGARDWDDTAIFGVLDGHGGVEVARFCEKLLPAEIAKGPAADPEAALISAYESIDGKMTDSDGRRELRALGPMRGAPFGWWSSIPESTGSTAVVCCLRPGEVVVANAGDSRAVMCCSGEAVDLSKDHKPTLASERKRIKEAGGWVDNREDRVNGDLALSRALGDHRFKKALHLPACDQIITCVPDVQRLARQASDEFILIACDGVWDVMLSQQVVSFIRQRLGPRNTWGTRLASGELKLSAIVEQLLDHCISPALASGDNLTAVLILLL